MTLKEQEICEDYQVAFITPNGDSWNPYLDHYGEEEAAMVGINGLLVGQDPCPQSAIFTEADIRLINRKRVIDFLTGRFDGKKIRSQNFRVHFSIQPIIFFVFVLTFLLLERLLSENAVVGYLVGRFWLIPCQHSSLVPLGTLVPSQLTCCVGTNLKLRR